MEEKMQVQQLAEPLYQAKGWMKFIGIVSIISGVISALTIFGLIYCWLPIWMGSTLISASNRLESARFSGDSGQLTESLIKLKSYFQIMGYSILAAILVTFLSLVLFAGIFATLFESISNSF